MTVNRRASHKTKAGSRDTTGNSRVDAVYEQILLAIVTGRLKGGEELKSTRLAERLGVSRTPVVQALQRLAADGLVELAANRRAVVRQGAENWLVEIHEMRELLEPEAAALAAVRATPQDLEELERLAEAAAPRAHRNWRAAAEKFDFALHLTLAKRCGNFALGEAIRRCWSFKRLSYLALPEPVENLERGYREHLAILAALRARDPQTARAAVAFHLRSAASQRPARTIV